MFVDSLSEYLDHSFVFILSVKQLIKVEDAIQPFLKHVLLWYLFFSPHPTTHQSIQGFRFQKATELHPHTLCMTRRVVLTHN